MIRKIQISLYFNFFRLEAELDQLVFKSLLQFVEAHVLLGSGHVEFQLLNINGRLALVGPCSWNEPTCLKSKHCQPTVEPEFSLWNIAR